MLSGNAALESTWAAQTNLAPLDPGLVEEVDGQSGKLGCYDIQRLLGEGEFAQVRANILKS